MRRCLLAIGLMLLCSTAYGRSYDVMVIQPKMINSPNSARYEAETVIRQNFETLQAILNRARTNYGVFQTFGLTNRQALEEYVRTGIFTRNDGRVDTAACVIYSSFVPGGSVAATEYGVKMDSLMRIAKGGANVPICFLIDNLVEVTSGVSGAAYFDDAGLAANRCSTGVVGVKANPSTGGAPVLADGSRRTWFGSDYTSGYVRNTTSPAGGLRPLLYSSTNGFGIIPLAGSNPPGNGQPNSVWADSLPFVNAQASDTMLVWDRLWNIATIPTAKPMTFVSWAGAGLSIADSLVNAASYPRPMAEGSVDVLMFGLAHFDSLTGGKIFGNMTKPYQIAVTVDGALTRNDRRRIPGIQPDDTTTFYASLDSIQALHIPITFGVNVDSAGSYGRDIIKLKSVSLARFTPQSWIGQQRGAAGDTTNGAGSGNAGRYKLVDPFGRFRPRAFVGDGSGIGADSSMASLLLYGRQRCDSLFGLASSKCLLAPYDDYSPRNMAPGPGCPPPDSLLAAFVAAGFNTIRSNNRWSNSRPGAGSEGRTNPRGWFTNQRTIRNSGTASNFKVVCDGGYMLQGGLRQVKFTDSTTTPQSIIGQIEVPRVLSELLTNRKFDFDTWGNIGSLVANFYTNRDVAYHTEDFQAPEFTVSSSAYAVGPGNVMMLHCSDLSGDSTNPARMGWWSLRWIAQWAQACNSAGRRPIFVFSYPEEIEP